MHEGERFDRLVVIGYSAIIDKFQKINMVVECDCGNVREVAYSRLVSGNTRSCGCIHHETVSDNLVGQRFGRLLVLEYAGVDKHWRSLWKVRCECGTENTGRRLGRIS